MAASGSWVTASWWETMTGRRVPSEVEIPARWAARMASAATAPKTGSLSPAAVMVSSTTPTSSLPSAGTAVEPPRASAATWAPRQMAMAGTSSATTPRSSSRRSASQGCSPSSWALMEPPSTTRPSPISSREGMGSPRQGRTMRREAPSAKSHSPRRPTGASSSGSMTVIVSVSVMGDILPPVRLPARSDRRRRAA